MMAPETAGAITLAKEAEEAASGLFLTAPFGIYHLGGDGLILDVNPAFARLLGFEGAQDLLVHGDRIGDLSPLLGEWHSNFRESNGSDTIEVELPRSNGAKVVTIHRGSLFVPAKGQEEICRVFVEDVTVLRRLEADLAQLHRVEPMAAVATGFASEINNALTPLLMCTRLLKTKLPEAERNQIAATVESSAERAARIIRQFLAYDPNHTGESSTKLADVFESIMRALANSFPRSIRLQHSVPSDIHPLPVPAGILHQALLNLCIEARDAMSSGGNLSIEAKNVELDEHYASMIPGSKAGPYVVIDVAHTGRTDSRVPDPAALAEASESDGPRMPVSRLVVASRMIKRLGGQLQMTGDPERGVRFQVYIPVTPRETTVPAAKEAAASVSGTRAFASTSSDLILLVEDDPVVASAAQTVLKTHGYRVLRAGDGTEALALYAQHQDEIRAVITDMLMPHMDGIALVRALRSIDEHVPIIASTARGRMADVRELDVEAILNKPYTATTMLRTLHAALKTAAA